MAIRPTKTAEIVEMKRFIQNPGMWPQWPVLPLKKLTRDWYEFGYLIAEEGGVSPIVRLGNIFTMSEKDPVREYDSIDAMLTDGWMVD